MNMQISYWTGSSGSDADDGLWNTVVVGLSQTVLQSKLRVVGPDLRVPRRFPAWAVRNVTGGATTTTLQPSTTTSTSSTTTSTLAPACFESLTLSDCSIKPKFRKRTGQTDKLRVKCRVLDAAAAVGGFDPAAENVFFRLGHAGGPCSAHELLPGECSEKAEFSLQVPQGKRLAVPWSTAESGAPSLGVDLIRLGQALGSRGQVHGPAEVVQALVERHGDARPRVPGVDWTSAASSSGSMRKQVVTIRSRLRSCPRPIDPPGA